MDGGRALLQAPSRFHAIMCRPLLPSLVRVMRKRHLHDIQKPETSPPPVWRLVRCHPFFVAAHSTERRRKATPSLSFFLGFSLGQSSHHGLGLISRCTQMQCALVRCGWVIGELCPWHRGEVRWQGRFACEPALPLSENNTIGPRLNFFRYLGCNDELGCWDGPAFETQGR